MINVLLGIIIGSFLPIQTTINGKLRVATGSPFRASQISVALTFVVLVIVMLIIGESFVYPWAELFAAPWWIWTGGVLGAVVIIGGIIAFGKLGAVQAAILPIAGQIVMGTLIDEFGMFNSPEHPLSALRVVGAILVLIGAIVTAMARFKSESGKKNGEVAYQILAVATGVANAAQTAINANLKLIVGTAIRATLINNVVCNLAIHAVCIFVFAVGISHAHKPEKGSPWWIWLGGPFGMGIVVGNIFMAVRVGTGYAVILLLIGMTVGGIVIDHFGLFDAPVKKLTVNKVLGIALMLAGSVLFRLM